MVKPMKGDRLASIIMALGNAYDYGTAAMLNSNAEERAALEEKMLNRLRAAITNAELWRRRDAA